MLSGGALCRQQDIWPLPESLFWSCGSQPRRAPPASSRDRLSDRRQSRSAFLARRPLRYARLPTFSPGQARQACGLCCAFLAWTAARPEGLARSRDQAAVTWVQRLRRGSPRARNWVGLVLGPEWEHNCRGGGPELKDYPSGTRFEKALPPPFQFPQWAEGVGRGFSGGELPVCFGARLGPRSRET